MSAESATNVRALVNPRECIACGECISTCPEHAIATDEKGKAKVNQDLCVGCGKCMSVCASKAISQVPLPVQIDMVEQIPNAVVTLRNEVSPWLMILQVVPDGWDFPDYKPGQFAMLGLPGTTARCAAADPEEPLEEPDRLIKRAYSLASSPTQREFLEFYVALVPGGTLTPRLFNLRIGDRIWLSKIATGRFTYDDSRVTKGSGLVLCTTGAGIAPLVSMLKTHLKFPPRRRVALIHGVRHSWDLGYRSILMAMQHLRTNFVYLPVVSRPDEEPVPWKGATGHVQDVWNSGAIEKAWGIQPGPKNTHVFMCGSPHMSESMIALLAQEGFKADTENDIGQIHVENYWQAT